MVHVCAGGRAQGTGAYCRHVGSHSELHVTQPTVSACWCTCTRCELDMTVGGEPWGVCKPGAPGPGGEAGGA